MNSHSGLRVYTHFSYEYKCGRDMLLSHHAISPFQDRHLTDYSRSHRPPHRTPSFAGPPQPPSFNTKVECTNLLLLILSHVISTLQSRWTHILCPNLSYVSPSPRRHISYSLALTPSRSLFSNSPATFNHQCLIYPANTLTAIETPNSP